MSVVDVVRNWIAFTTSWYASRGVTMAPLITVSCRTPRMEEYVTVNFDTPAAVDKTESVS
jgi:hypothetical protein